MLISFTDDIARLFFLTERAVKNTMAQKLIVKPPVKELFLFFNGHKYRAEGAKPILITAMRQIWIGQDLPQRIKDSDKK